MELGLKIADIVLILGSLLGLYVTKKGEKKDKLASYGLYIVIILSSVVSLIRGV